MLRLGGQYDSQKYSQSAKVSDLLLSLSGFICVFMSVFLIKVDVFCLFCPRPAGILLHQVVDTETASGQ